MKKACVFIVLVAAFSFLAGNLFAQNNAQELRFGARTNGRLNQSSEVWYRITPNQNSFMVIEISSDDFDTYVEVYDNNRNLLAEDDDGGEDTNSKVELYGARNTAYLVKVRSYDNEESGAFRILASYKPVPQAVELRIGTTRGEKLGREDEHWYSVRTTSAGLVTVQTFGDNVDTFLEAYDSNYKLISSNDDGGEGTNARVAIVAEANQTYFFKLRAYDYAETGQYDILASFESLPQDARNTERSRAVVLNIGDKKPGFFYTSEDRRWYRFTVPRGGANIRVYTEGEMDTYVYLYDGRGDLIDENDDSEDSFNAMIFKRLDAGTYYIELKDYSGNTGPFTVCVD